MTDSPQHHTAAEGNDSEYTGPAIDVFIGTKAQYIKTAPLMRLMQARGIPYQLIDSGQHADLSVKLRKELGIKEPDAHLGTGESIETLTSGILWLIRYFALALFRPRHMAARLFSPSPGYCFIHGDTSTTLLSLFMAKRAGKKVVHIEAGLRSFNLLRPFPEELIRIICMRYSDLLFAPSEWAYKNLLAMKVKGRAINLGQNTNVEAVAYALGQPEAGKPVRPKPYCIITIHRLETIFRKNRLLFVIDLLERIAESHHILFVMHGPTKRVLEKNGLLGRLESIAALEILPLQPHADFLKLLAGAEFAITDGGSIQEETHYLNIPCLVMRSETERMEGVGSTEGLEGNVCLAGFDAGLVDDFLMNLARYRQGKETLNSEPSKIILDTLLATPVAPRNGNDDRQYAGSTRIGD